MLGDDGAEVPFSDCVEDLTALEGLVKEYKSAYAQVRESENKVFGFDRIDLRIGGLLSRIETAIRRVCGYINGEYTSLEELEMEKLAYNGYEITGHKKLVSMDRYDSIPTASSEGVS